MILPVFEHCLAQASLFPKAKLIMKLDATFVEGNGS
jgi:hypothetical protein